jgi:hypothetical protein
MTPHHTNVVKQIKCLFEKAPILAIPSNGTFIICIDASESHWGAVFLELQNNGSDAIVHYANGSVDDNQCNYLSMEKEILMIVKSLKYFKFCVAC